MNRLPVALQALIPTLLLATTVVAETTPGPLLEIELEGGPVWQSSNDVQIPNDEDGTRFSASEVQGSGPWPAARAMVTWNLARRHSLRALAAPLSITETGPLEGPTRFAGGSFDAAVPTEVTYRFNSWRVTYAYRLHEGHDSTWWIGFTAKVRDAEVALAQGGTRAEKTDLGFVPLLHVRGSTRLSGPWRLLLDLDALAGGPGRAIDGAVKLGYDLDDRWSLSAGYRTVEGGADVDEVYNFAWLHYAVASVIARY